jgi:DNA repair photolyase
MPEIIKALADSGTPFSILTKGTLMLRDLPLLEAAARDVSVGLAMSVGSIDESVWRTVEPGTPSPARRLEAVRTLADAGLGCSVLMAPILPFLTDSPEQLRQTVAAIAGAGARSVTPIVLHLRSGAREWYYEWLQATYPSLVPRYRALYRNGSYAPSWYQDRITSAVREFAKAYGLVRPKAVTDVEETDGAGDTNQEPKPGSFRNTRKPTARATETAETQPALWDDKDLNPS